MRINPRYSTLRPEQKLRTRAIQHAQMLADKLNGVITVLRYIREDKPFEPHSEYEFGCAYIDSTGAIYNAMPANYWSTEMAEYRRGMPSYKLVKT